MKQIIKTVEKNITVCMLLFSIVLTFFAAMPLKADDMIILTWKGNKKGNVFEFWADSGKTITINWGDGETDNYVGNGTTFYTEDQKIVATHTYTIEGLSIVTITGEVVGFKCHKQRMLTLDISKNEGLLMLDCYYNKLRNLDLSKNKRLAILNCSKNIFTQINVSQNLELKKLICFDNELTSLNVTGNKSLNYLDCYKNKLTALNVSTNEALDTLICSVNKIMNLDITGNKKLIHLSCNKNSLSSLNIIENAALKYINCCENPLSTDAYNAIFVALPRIISIDGTDLGNIHIKSNLRTLTSTKRTALEKGWNVWMSR